MGVGTGNVERPKQTREILPIDAGIDRASSGISIRCHIYRRAADCWIKSSSDREDGITLPFEIESRAVHACKQTIFGINGFGIDATV